MKIYIAAKYARRYELRSLVEKLKEIGHEVTSQWIYDSEPEKSIKEAAERDINDVLAAECLVFIGEPQASENRGGGRWFEFGFAYAKEKRCIAVLSMDPSKGGHDHLPIGHESVFTALLCVEIVHSQEELLSKLS